MAFSSEELADIGKFVASEVAEATNSNRNKNANKVIATMCVLAFGFGVWFTDWHLWRRDTDTDRAALQHHLQKCPNCDCGGTKASNNIGSAKK